jgi:hypothetical protein
MSRSVRVIWKNIQGRQHLNFNWPPIHKASAVFIAAAEWAPAANPDPYTPGPPGRPFIGEATISVTNIAPHDPEGTSSDGGVEFYLHVDWESPINVVLTITVLDDYETWTVVE